MRAGYYVGESKKAVTLAQQATGFELGSSHQLPNFSRRLTMAALISQSFPNDLIGAAFSSRLRGPVIGDRNK